MGEADSKAAEIYNNAYNRSDASRNFYEFIKKMEMYKKLPDNANKLLARE